MGKAIVLIGPRQLVKQPWFMLLKDIPFLFFWMVIGSWLKLWQKLIPKP
jgi:hypothetical protein